MSGNNFHILRVEQDNDTVLIKAEFILPCGEERLVEIVGKNYEESFLIVMEKFDLAVQNSFKKVMKNEYKKYCDTGIYQEIFDIAKINNVPLHNIVKTFSISKWVDSITT